MIEEIKQKTDIQIELISGDDEALWIYRGVQMAVPTKGQRAMIMDIGGGSVEFIMVENGQLNWSKSFPIGVAVLKKTFQKSDPISQTEILEITQYLENTLLELSAKINNFQPNSLIGASGTFDVLENYLGKKEKAQIYSVFSADRFEPLYQKLITMSIESCKMEPNIPEARAEMISVALILIRKILSYGNFRQILVSPYALKEGILSEMMLTEK